jgi:hypothetical protein
LEQHFGHYELGIDELRRIEKEKSSHQKSKRSGDFQIAKDIPQKKSTKQAEQDLHNRNEALVR